MIDEINFFDQPTKSHLKHMKTSERLELVKVMITQLDVYQIIPISKNYYKLIAIDLSKQQKLDANPKAIQQINFTVNLSRSEDATMFFITEEAKEKVLE